MTIWIYKGFPIRQVDIKGMILNNNWEQIGDYLQDALDRDILENWMELAKVGPLAWRSYGFAALGELANNILYEVAPRKSEMEGVYVTKYYPMDHDFFKGLYGDALNAAEGDHASRMARRIERWASQK
jgi:hypothetical protein